MDDLKENIRIIAIEFAYWVQTKCFYNIKGYMLYSDHLGDDRDDNEYQVDELYDYWLENVYLKNIENEE